MTTTASPATSLRPSPPSLSSSNNTSPVLSSLTRKYPTTRKNHLRTKFPQTLTLDPILPPTPSPQPQLLLLKEEATSDSLALSEAVGPTQVKKFTASGLLLNISFGVLVLLAVQIVVAVAVFGGVEEEREEVVEVGEWDGEFEKKVEVIRAMAKDVRAREAEEGSGESGIDAIKVGVREDVSRRLRSLGRELEGRKVGIGGSGKDRIRRKLELQKIRAQLSRKSVKGFGGSMLNVGAMLDVYGGSVQQIGHVKLLDPSSEMQKRSVESKREITEDSVRATDLSDLSSQNLEHPQSSNQGGAERFQNGHGRAAGMTDNSRFSEDVPSHAPFDNSISHKQKHSSRKTSRVTRRTNVSLNKDNSGSSQLSQSKSIGTNRSPHPPVSPKSMPNSWDNVLLGSQRHLWWLKLPYVLGICLRRGSDDNGVKGLYTLRDDPHADESLSYTIVFQDRGDATNFCYVLESYFVELGDVSADIVPMSIQELKEAIYTKVLNVVVVRKGQLQIYAGQPLSEIEMALRSIVEQSLPRVGS